ncbi:hypothetical protein [Lonepinella sp. MS14437]|uniref:hypothetical protein n=1 Tax=Lonepinella sp. MS14437 TaxID=3003620 RepID=UPI0036DEB1CD
MFVNEDDARERALPTVKNDLKLINGTPSIVDFFKRSIDEGLPLTQDCDFKQD